MLLETIRAAREPGWHELRRLYLRTFLTRTNIAVLLIAIALNATRYLVVNSALFPVQYGMQLLFVTYSVDFFALALVIMVARFFARARKGELFMHLAATGMPVTSILAPLFDILMGYVLVQILIEWLLVVLLEPSPASSIVSTALHFAGSAALQLPSIWLWILLLILLNVRRSPLGLQVLATVAYGWVTLVFVTFTSDLLLFPLMQWLDHSWIGQAVQKHYSLPHRFGGPANLALDLSWEVAYAAWCPIWVIGAVILTRILRHSSNRLSE